MRIIDKHKDFYDFYQNIYRDNHFTFDRRNSWDVKREEFHIYVPSYKHFMLLQAGNKFWLFLYQYSHEAKDYSLSLLSKWEDYDANRILNKLSSISFYPSVYYDIFDNLDEKTIQKLVAEIKHNNFRYITSFERKFPILQNLGFASFIDPLEFYNAIEEYLSLEATAAERTESIGLTNNEKIENHGFDIKTSFIGK